MLKMTLCTSEWHKILSSVTPDALNLAVWGTIFDS